MTSVLQIITFIMRKLTTSLFLRLLTIFLLVLTVNVSLIRGQVTIGALTPPEESAVLELKSENADKGFLPTRVSLKNIRDTETIKNPALGLMVFNIGESPEDTDFDDRVIKNKFYYWVGDHWMEMTDSTLTRTWIEHILAQMGISRPALFLLDGKTYIYKQGTLTNMQGFYEPLNGIPINSARELPFREVVNYTDDKVKFERRSGLNTSKIIFEPGIYSILFGYEFVPASDSYEGTLPPDCIFSPYFVDFPMGRNNSDGSPRLVRIYSNCSHENTWYANHGNSITHVVKIEEPTEWIVKFGLGNAQTANRTCVRLTYGGIVGVGGFIMPNRSTFVYVLRIGDI